jgi:hypothetical protein
MPMLVPGYEAAPAAPRTIGAAALVLVLAIGAPAAPAADPARELSTDRPDVTESPYSVPRGWLQLEMDGLVWSRHERDVVETRTLGVAATNLKLGLSGRADLQLVFEPWVRTRLDEAGMDTATESGTGEMAVRFKWNLLGNDGGPVAVGLLPWAAWDTRQRGRAIADAAGVAIPLSFDLGERIGGGAMIEGSVADDERALLASATCGFTLAGPLGGFGEFVAERAFVDAGADEWRSTLNLGATLGIGSDLQLDAGVRFGLTDAVEDFTGFLGFAARRRLR